MKQKLLTSTLALFVMGCTSMSGGVPEAHAGQLVSVVESRYIVPPIVPRTDSVANGGFFISGYGRGGGIGDGGDESTAWFHSFNLDRPQWKAFKEAYGAQETSDKRIIIRSARLELKYSPRVAGNGNDYIRITGLKGIAIRDFDGFRNAPPTDPRERQTVSIELLADDRYTSKDILNMLNLGRDLVKREQQHDREHDRKPGSGYTAQSGVFLMRYADDAIIHYAKLTLKYALVTD